MFIIKRIEVKFKGFLLLSLLVVVTGCGFVNDVGIVSRNVVRTFTPHLYSVKDGEEEEIFRSGKGIVDLNFTGNIATAWQRVDKNGDIDTENYTLTYNELGSRGRRRSQLKPGTYFFNGFFEDSKIITGYYANSINIEPLGWDKEKNEARCFSFTIRAGETLVIPDIQYNGFDENKMKMEDSICPKLSYTIEPPADAPYKIGPESKAESDK
jgi:hypothetical protein